MLAFRCAIKNAKKRVTKPKQKFNLGVPRGDSRLAWIESLTTNPVNASLGESYENNCSGENPDVIEMKDTLREEITDWRSATAEVLADVHNSPTKSDVEPEMDGEHPRQVVGPEHEMTTKGKDTIIMDGQRQSRNSRPNKKTFRLSEELMGFPVVYLLDDDKQASSGEEETSEKRKEGKEVGDEEEELIQDDELVVEDIDQEEVEEYLAAHTEGKDEITNNQLMEPANLDRQSFVPSHSDECPAEEEIHDNLPMMVESGWTRTLVLASNAKATEEDPLDLQDPNAELSPFAVEPMTSSERLRMAREERLKLQLETTRRLCVKVLGLELFQEIHEYILRTQLDPDYCVADPYLSALLETPEELSCARHVARLVHCELLLESTS